MLVASLAGCGAVERLATPQPPGTAATTAPTAAAEPSSSPAVPSVDVVRTSGTPVQAVAVTVLHVLPTGTAPQIRLEAQGDETVLTLDPGGVSAAVDVLLAAPAGAALAPQDDASIVALAGDGTFLGGAGRPSVAAGAAPVTLEPEPDGALHLRGTGPITLRVGADALLAADWGEREGGRSLAVEPSPWARTAGMAGEVGTWTELVRAYPEVDTQTMRDQLTCHVIGAPDKATWNLEPWRPDIGLLGTLAAACNQT